MNTSLSSQQQISGPHFLDPLPAGAVIVTDGISDSWKRKEDGKYKTDSFKIKD